MNFFSLFLFSILFFACGKNEVKNEKKVFTKNESIPVSVVEKSIRSDYPAEYCLDSSWNILTDDQEGLFLGYTIQTR
jgi:hypothetical protein